MSCGMPAFDSVDRQALWKALRATGAPSLELRGLPAVHCGRSALWLSNIHPTAEMAEL